VLIYLPDGTNVCGARGRKFEGIGYRLVVLESGLGLLSPFLLDLDSDSDLIWKDSDLDLKPLDSDLEVFSASPFSSPLVT